MKRGRPSKRLSVQSEIISTLSSSNVPLTTAFMAREISKRTGQKINWNTVNKYLGELVASEKVQPIELPHSKKEGARGLTLYIVKK